MRGEGSPPAPLSPGLPPPRVPQILPVPPPHGPETLPRHRRRHRQRPRRHLHRHRPHARPRHPADQTLAPRAGFRRALLRRHLGRLRARRPRGLEKRPRLTRRHRRDRLRRHLLARCARCQRPPGLRQPHWPRRAERDRLDGSPRPPAGRGHQPHPPPRVALRRRRHLARDADAQAPLAETKPAGHLAPRRPFPRPAGFPHLPRHQRRHPLALHHRLQVDLPWPPARRLG